MTLPDVTKITVDCKDCGGPLEVRVDDTPSPDWGWSMVVKPCETCIAKAEKDGEDAGYDDARLALMDESDSLEAEIGVLNQKVEELEAELQEAKSA